MHSAKKRTMTTTCLSIVVIYCFIVAQLCKEDDDMATFSHCRFYLFIYLFCFVLFAATQCIVQRGGGWGSAQVHCCHLLFWRWQQGSFPALSFFCLFFCYSSTHSAKRRRTRMTHLSTLSLLFGVLLQCSYMKKTTMQELSTLSLFFFFCCSSTQSTKRRTTTMTHSSASSSSIVLL
jgi:TRAP-type uncharacterized transport system fused permease subunit